MLHHGCVPHLCCVPNLSADQSTILCSSPADAGRFFFQKKPMTEERANEKSEERRVPKMTGDREAGSSKNIKKL